MNITSPTTVLISLVLSIAFSFSSYATPVNINSANAQLIANSLAGIGKYKAAAIINYRNKHGLFKQARDIVNVKGIGKATYNKNRADILVK